MRIVATAWSRRDASSVFIPLVYSNADESATGAKARRKVRFLTLYKFAEGDGEGGAATEWGASGEVGGSPAKAAAMSSADGSEIGA
jgi:hypothetical protein